MTIEQFLLAGAVCWTVVALGAGAVCWTVVALGAGVLLALGGRYPDTDYDGDCPVREESRR